MRRYVIAAGMMFAATAPTYAQHLFGPPIGCFPGRTLGFYFAGRNLHLFGYLHSSPGYGYWNYSPYIWSPSYVLPAGFMSNTVIISQTRTTAPVTPAAVLPNLPTVPPLEERDDVIVIRPKAGGVRNLPPPRPGIVNHKKEDRPFDPPPLLAPRADKNKGAELARQLAQGKEAFAAGEYGRALERFRHGLRLDPEHDAAIFLKATVEFALGKYAEAAATLVAGINAKPDWPVQRIAWRELYGAKAADAALHLESLRQAVEANPNEPALLFLYAHQLWFDNRRAEAKEFFRRALPLVADPKPVQRFLDEPDEPVAKR